MDESSKSGLKRLINLFGVPSILETGCSIGGKTGRRILRHGEDTGYSVGGQTGSEIVSREGERIGSVAMKPTQRIYALNGKPTNYLVGGSTGKKILYLKVRRVS